MAELATLGIEVQTQNVDQATSKLSRLTGAARQVEAAMSGIGSSSLNAGRISSSALEGMASRMKAVERVSRDAERALAAEGLAAQRAAAQLKQHSNAANDNLPVMTKTHNAANLAAQGFDIVTSAAGGMSAGLIGMQQGLQVAQVAMTSTNGFAKDLAASFRAMLSPVTFLAVGLTALAALGIQQVNWSKLAANALIGLANVLDDIAPYAVAAAGALALLYAPTIIGGVVQLIALLGRLAVQAVALAAAFAAANPATAFVLGITAAVAAAVIFRDELAEIFGRDIVADAKNAVNFIIGAFVGGYEGIKAAWSKLPAALGDIVMSTANAVITGVENMINNVSTAINGYIQSINKAISSIPGMSGVQMGTIGTVSLGRISNPYAGAANEAQTAIGAAISGAQGVDYVGGFGEAISRGASAASAKLKELAKDLTTVDDKSKKKGSGGKTEAEKYSDIVEGANRRIASLKAEQQAIGMTEEASARLKYETDLFNQAQQKGITLTAAQKAELSGLAGTMAGIETATKKAKEALDFAKDATKGFISDLRSGLQNGEGFWKSFGTAAMNVLNKIIDKIEGELVDALFSLNSKGTGSGAGGLIGGLLGGIGKIFGFASGGYTGNGARTQAAGIVHGQEYVFSAAATKRIGVKNLDAMHSRAKGYESGGYVAPARTAANYNGGQSVYVQTQIGVSVDDDGKIQAYVKKESTSAVDSATPGIVSKSVKYANASAPSSVAQAQDKAVRNWRTA